MNAVALLVATAVLGVDYGWHRLPNGEWEYIIQIEPALVETLVQGQALVSQMPPELQGVRRFRVQVGEGEVPRDQLPTTPVGGTVAGSPLPGAVGASTGVGGLGGAGTGGGFGTTPFRGGTGLGSSRAATAGGVWPIGIDSRVLSQLRFYEWVSLEPIELLPLENDFLRQLGGPEPMPRDDRPWEQFTPRTNLPSSRWPAAGRADFDPNATQPLNTRSTTERSPLSNMVRDWNRSGSAASPWKLDQPSGDLAADPRNASLLPRPAGEVPPDREVDQFDLNDQRAGRNGAGTWPTTGGAPAPTNSSGPFAARGTQRGVIEDRETSRRTFTNGQTAASHPSATSPSPFTTTRTTRGAITEEAVGAQVWWPLTMTVVLLFASLGGNLYLGWLAMDFYRRYRDAAWELRTSDGPG